MAISEELQVLITANTAEITQRLDALNQKLESTATTAESSGSRMDKALQMAGKAAKVAAAALTAVVAGGAVLVKNAMAQIDAQAKLSQQLNTTSQSLATLQRAGELSGIGMEKIGAAGRALTVRLAQAAQGTGPAVQALDQLNLSAEELSAMPLDERIATINTRIKETIPAANQAALAAQLFGEEAGVAMARLDADVLNEARQQAELFGTALTDVDAAKVEQANDALTTITMVVQGLIQQLTVKFAPILKAIGDMFFDTAKEAGGFGNVASGAFNAVIKTISFVASAIDVVQRSFKGLGAIIRIALFGTIELVSSGLIKFYELLDKIPGVDLSAPLKSMKEFNTNLDGVVNGAIQDLAEVTTKPLAGDVFEKFIADAEAAGTAAAAAAVKARAAVPVEAAGDFVSPEEKKKAEEDAKKAEEELARQREKNEEYLQQIRERLMSETELEEAQYAERRARIQEMDAELFAYEGEKNLLLAEMEAEHYDKLAEIQERALTDEQKRQREFQKKGLTGHLQYLQSIIGAADQHSKTLFNIKKVAALAEAAISIPKTVMSAYEYGNTIGGPPVGAAMAGIALAAQVANMRSIAAASFGGGTSVSGAGATSVGGAADAQAAAARDQGERAQPGRIVNVSLQGDVYSRDSVRGLLTMLQEEAKDGATDVRFV